MPLLLRSVVGVGCRIGHSPHIRRFFATTVVSQASGRYYRYAIDVHGQLFLHDTTPKNLTSCFKNPDFLDFFFARIKPLQNTDSDTKHQIDDEQDRKAIEDPEWTENVSLSEARAFRLAFLDNYRWVSPCQGEFNFIRSEDSPIVFRELDQDGTLRWAGSYTANFDPSSLKVHPHTGYVYHPSPVSPLKSVRQRVEETGPSANPYGSYSLLSSALVLQRLASGLDVDSDTFAVGKGGSIEWKGQRWDMGVITDDDLK